MNVNRRLIRLEKASRVSALAEVGLRAIQRVQSGVATDADAALIVRPGALSAVSDEELDATIEILRRRLAELEGKEVNDARF